MRSDILITTWNCSECANIKAKLNRSAIFDDEFLGTGEQHLILLGTFSNIGAKEILDRFNFPKEAITPALMTYNYDYILTVQEIEEYLKWQGFIDA